MKAEDCPFAKFINGTSQFVIPVFQRDYSWTEEECEQLWTDVGRIGDAPAGRTHFIGSLVYAPAGDTVAALTRWLLIDGQQRLTTLTLILLALRRHLTDTGWTGSVADSPTAKRIEAYFLKNVQEDGERQYKLVLRRNDHAALKHLLDGAELPADLNSRVLDNFAYFLERLREEGDPERVYRGISRLVIVGCRLDAHDDPQLVFESLNSTGKELSQADQIRNYVLMRLPEREQTRLYETYWRPIEDLFRTNPATMDGFARDYLGMRTRASRQTRAADVYVAFRAFFAEETQRDGLEPVLADMRRYARYYAAFVLSPTLYPALETALARLHRHAEVAAMIVMRLFDYWDRAKSLTTQQFTAALAMLESYAFRRAVCAMQTRNYWAVFAGIAHRLQEGQPLDRLAALLFGLSEVNRFPDDETFVAELERRDVYTMRSCHYLLDRLENFDTNEITPTATLTIEHVMPQTTNLRKEWREMLGADWKAIHTSWVHRLGNLSLTGYNSTYQDRPFDEKKTTPKGFNDSSVRLNRFVREQQTWDVTAMEARGQALAALAARVWPPLVVSDAALRNSRQEELRARAAQRTLATVPMTDEARALFDLLRPGLLELDPGIIEVPAEHSIVYHAADADFFLEILPRKSRLLLLLNLEYAECEHKDDNVRDSNSRKFIVHATQDGGTIYRLWAAANIAAALKPIRQAYELAAR